MKSNSSEMSLEPLKQSTDPTEVTGETAHQFEALLRSTAEQLDMFVTPDKLATDIEDIPFGRYSEGTISVGSTTSGKSYDGYIRFAEPGDFSHSFDARCSTHVHGAEWIDTTGVRRSNRQQLNQIVAEWPLVDDDRNPGKEQNQPNDICPQRVVEVIENYALRHDSGTKSHTSEWHYGGTIKSDGRIGSRPVKTKFELSSGTIEGTTIAKMEVTYRLLMRNTTVPLTYHVETDEIGTIHMYVEHDTPEGRTIREPVKDPEAILPDLTTIAENMIEDKTQAILEG